MRSIAFIALLPGLAAAATKIAKVAPQPKINGTVEYSSQCKTCPYNLCTNVNTPYGGDNVTLTCWANGDKVGDTKLWLKTTDNCYITEYDLVEYSGDFSADLPTCGHIPLKITKQDNEVRYLSECKWTSYTSSESIKFYGRDQDITLTCVVPDGDNILNNTNWYKTTDNCHVSATGLWQVPDNSKLDNCGPDPYPRANETKRSIDSFKIKPKTKKSTKKTSLLRRWLQPGLIGEEYAPCLSCPSKTANATCKRVKNYEYNQTVISQCFKEQLVNYPNGTTGIDWFMLTTDWCYVDPDNFWDPPYDHYRYPVCDDFPGGW